MQDSQDVNSRTIYVHTNISRYNYCGHNASEILTKSNLCYPGHKSPLQKFLAWHSCWLHLTNILAGQTAYHTFKQHHYTKVCLSEWAKCLSWCIELSKCRFSIEILPQCLRKPSGKNTNPLTLFTSPVPTVPVFYFLNAAWEPVFLFGGILVLLLPVII